MRITTAVILCALLSVATGEAAGRRTGSGSRPTPRFTATAYCLKGHTESGTRTRSGIVAADPRVLPVGSVVRIMDGPSTGIYTVMDTGPAVRGHTLDIFMPKCAHAHRFGRRLVHVRVLRHGWDPKASVGDGGPGRAK